MATQATSADLPKTTRTALSRVLQPIETARGLPNDCYTDPAVYALESARIFAGGWACAGFAHDVAAPGDLHPFEIAGMPLLMLRDGDGAIRVFHNVCRHRGRILVPAPGHTRKAIAYPYHSWTYGLDGRLIGTPHIGGPGVHACAGFDGENISLAAVRSAEWFGLVFVDLSGEAEDFAAYIGPVADRWRAFDGVALSPGGDAARITFDLACNWKLAVENYCEAYHLPWVHPALNKYSPLDRHYAIIAGGHAGQGTEIYAPKLPKGCPPFPDAPGLTAPWHTGSEYIALFPNVLLGMHRDHFYAGLVLPDGPGRTRERFDYFYFAAAGRDATFAPSRAANRDLWRAVFAEDQDAVESMQSGRASPGFDGGIFSPAMDPATHAFHAWVARALLDGRGPLQDGTA